MSDDLIEWLDKLAEQEEEHGHTQAPCAPALREAAAALRERRAQVAGLSHRIGELEDALETLRHTSVPNLHAAFVKADKALSEARRDTERFRKALAFARSCILSGESWTDTCDEVIDGAFDAAREKEGEG